MFSNQKRKKAKKKKSLLLFLKLKSTALRQRDNTVEDTPVEKKGVSVVTVCILGMEKPREREARRTEDLTWRAEELL